MPPVPAPRILNVHSARAPNQQALAVESGTQATPSTASQPTLHEESIVNTRTSYTTAVFALATVILLGTMAPRAAFADHQRTIVGSWMVSGTPDVGAPFVNIGTFHRDGTVVNSDPVFGGGHGVWKRVGPRKYEVRFLSLVPPNNPFFAPNVVIEVRGVVRLNRRGKKASAPFVTTFTDPNGNLLMTSTGRIELTRITLN